ncbi:MULTISPECIES: GntR family transcriptional regulator [Enterococcus]|uniref:GntR family transcriptional regulator n=1 Tax=Enterococcus thailandicus TaxID=417368 RepID=A0A179ET94_ENTTH|nr:MULTISPECIES: GntR family transcriptional regulator [Enterococcus]ASZ08378.1 GntR family transcriptional regulator [Enterococcus thailandicus]MDA3965059.1 GntR family transcriptional regulator [Enterococcus thailandicus]MDK4352044.1 GntR family transcriptional regulator [Enterococcus thailandicus]MDT2734460.1 GntR family transcriptional regulator [Enterococcus thailandicus]MDT2752664.1 GntR family transcriptional regulator [Enterococcus thailandicus]
MIPKYEQIKQDLLAEIKKHKFIPGDKFYSEADIKQKYSVSSITAVKALNELTTAGYLYRIQGKGTFVSKSKVSQSVKFSDIELHSLDKEKVKVLAIEEENHPTILKELGLPANASYYKIKRVRFFEDVPFLLHITHLPKKLVKEPLTKDLSTYASIYERVRKDFDIDLFSLSSVETDEIIFSDNSELLNLLQLSFREPVVKQVKHSYLADQSVAEYIVSYKHWKYFKTKIEVEAE